MVLKSKKITGSQVDFDILVMYYMYLEYSN
jgi:hypothetical protein